MTKTLKTIIITISSIIAMILIVLFGKDLILLKEYTKDISTLIINLLGQVSLLILMSLGLLAFSIPFVIKEKKLKDSFDLKGIISIIYIYGYIICIIVYFIKMIKCSSFDVNSILRLLTVIILGFITYPVVVLVTLPLRRIISNQKTNDKLVIAIGCISIVIVKLIFFMSNFQWFNIIALIFFVASLSIIFGNTKARFWFATIYFN